MLESFHQQDGNTRIIRLETRAAVRLSEASDEKYDCYDLPIDKSNGATHKGSSFGRKMKILASYLTARINPSFQECHVVVVESEQGLAIEVGSVAPGRTAGAGGADRMLFTAPLATLLDVSTDSVIEKDNVVFTQLPDSFSPGTEKDSVLRPVVKEEQKTPKKGEIISTLFSAYGDIGLTLTFKAPRVGAPSGKPLTKATMRFVSTAERDTWMAFCMEAYVGLLLDSIRNGEERICPPAVVAEAAKATGAHERGGKAAAVSPSVTSGGEPRPPPRDVVERYIDFFLAPSGRSGGSGGGGEDRSEDNGTGVWDGGGGGAPAEPPCDGLLRVAEGGGSQHHAHLRRLSRAKWTVREAANGAGDGGQHLTQTIDCLLLQKGKASQRSKKGMPAELWLPLDSFTVYAEDEEHGESFCLELHSPPLGQTRGPDGPVTAPPASPSSVVATSAKATGGGGGSSAGLLSTVTLQLIAESHGDRKKWLRWFGLALGKQVLYLAQARQEAEAEKAQAAKSKTRFLGGDVNW